MRIARVERIVAAALCALAAASAQAVELGTLFHTPEERARLDRLRRGEPAERVAQSAARRGELTGFVKRSDGRGTVWIDGVPMLVTPKAAPLLDPKAVRGYAERDDDNLRIERRPTR